MVRIEFNQDLLEPETAADLGRVLHVTPDQVREFCINLIIALLQLTRWRGTTCWVIFFVFPGSSGEPGSLRAEVYVAWGRFTSIGEHWAWGMAWQEAFRPVKRIAGLPSDVAERRFDVRVHHLPFQLPPSRGKRKGRGGRRRGQ
ncbi:MAG: hypothetical protein KatS3mg081_0741 [Gemmatimonadales bacterium]|nr:MAG: hypothetical protein KatS3mg081_0741 [Gemmatimonadales bacterium]